MTGPSASTAGTSGTPTGTCGRCCTTPRSRTSERDSRYLGPPLQQDRPLRLIEFQLVPPALRAGGQLEPEIDGIADRGQLLPARVDALHDGELHLIAEELLHLARRKTELLGHVARDEGVLDGRDPEALRHVVHQVIPGLRPLDRRR